MVKRAVTALLLLTLLTTAVVWPQPAPAAAQGGPDSVPPTFPPARANYFPETGISAVNYFWETWNNTPNALFTLGFPISRPFIEESPTNPGEYYRVQYFERAVLEEHPENYFGPRPGQHDFYILGQLLGRLLAEGRENEPPFQPVANPGGGVLWFPETQHTLQAPFRSFWEQNGGVAVYGFPISEAFEEVNEADGQTYLVQYFERQRMEFHPENPPEFQILLGLLGRELANRRHPNNPAFDPGSARDNLPTQFIYGYNAHLYGDQDPTGWQDRPRALQLATNSQIYWIRQQVAWEDLQDISGQIFWGELDRIVDDANAAGVNLLLSVVRAPQWASIGGAADAMPSRENFGLFADFMGQMANRYRGRVPAYQIWNEPNLAIENGGTVANADYYVDLLAAAYDSIKAQDPYAIVVSAAPSPTETNRPNEALPDDDYTRSMLSNPNFRADAISAHPGGMNNPPDALYPDNPGPNPGWDNSREFYFRRIQDIRQAMLDTGYGDYQIWLTEFGWATENNTPGYEYGFDNSQEEQATYIRRAFDIGRNEWAPWMGAMFLWNLNFSVPWTQLEGNALHEQAAFSVLNGDWSPRPAWFVIQQMPKD